MSINKFEKDMNIIKALPDEPNDVGGLSADQLKSKFDEGGIALKEFINDEIVPALEDLTVIAEGAAHTILDKNGNAMAQRPKMQFNGTVTDNGTATVITYTASDVGAREAEWMPTIEEIGAAPASHVADKNNPHGVTTEQIGAAPAIESEEHAGCYYRTVNDETEWLNPPMIAGVEYRTTGRFKSKPVYRKLVSYYVDGSVGTTQIFVPHGISNFGELVRVTGNGGGRQFPIIFDLAELTTAYAVDATNVFVRCKNSDTGAGYWYFDLEYTKA